MKYIVFFLILLLVVLLKIYIIRENFETITQIERTQAIQNALINGEFYDRTVTITTDKKKEIIDKLKKEDRLSDVAKINKLYPDSSDENKFSTEFTIKGLIDETPSKITEATIIADVLNLGSFYDTPPSATETNVQRAARLENESKTDYSKSLNDYNIEYHDSPEKIVKEEGSNLDTDIMFLYDPIQNKKVAVTRPVIQSSVTFYKPGEYKYGAASYVPDYSDSVLLSRSNNFLDNKPKFNPPTFTYYDINNSSSNKV